MLPSYLLRREEEEEEEVEPSHLLRGEEEEEEEPSHLLRVEEEEEFSHLLRGEEEEKRKAEGEDQEKEAKEERPKTLKRMVLSDGILSNEDFKIPNSEELHVKQVDPSNLEINIKRKLNKKEELPLIRAGREYPGLEKKKRKKGKNNSGEEKRVSDMTTRDDFELRKF